MPIVSHLKIAAIVRGLNLTLGLCLAGISALLLASFVWPSPADRHGGIWGLFGVIMLAPAAVGFLAAWFAFRRQATWRWYAQALPLVGVAVSWLLMTPVFS